MTILLFLSNTDFPVHWLMRGVNQKAVALGWSLQTSEFREGPDGRYRLIRSPGGADLRGVLDFWRPDNPAAGHSTLSFSDKLYSMLGGSSNDAYDMLIEGHSWRKSDYLTLNELYISYKFDGNRLRQVLGLRGLSITLTGNNLFTATSLIEGNPQRTELTSSYYPIMRTVRLGLKLDF